MALYNLFVGPYVEYLAPVQPRRRGSWSNGLETIIHSLRWAGLSGDPVVVQVRRKKMWQVCGVPLPDQRGIPREMLWFLNYALADRGSTLSFDWREIDRVAEIAWFKRAYADELAVLERAAGHPSPVWWGVVAWTHS